MEQLKKLHALFRPQSIAIIGASSNLLKPGGQPLQALLASGYPGAIYPINPRYPELNGLKCYPDLKAIGVPVDLAIIAVPKKNVVNVLRQCVQEEVKTAIIFTSGFAETGEEGLKLQDELVAIARLSGLRFAGPNCLGIVNAPEKVMANFAVSHQPERVVKENAFAFISQSGGFGTIAYAEAQKQGLGAETLVSTGNEADLDFTTFLRYMVKYTDVKAIGAYLEGVKNGKEFVQAADQALAKGVPLIILKVGKHQVSALAAQSHTGSMVGDDDLYQGFFEQKGIIRVNSVEEMLPLINLFSDQKMPQGKRVGVLSTSGGGSVHLTDLCLDAGLEVIPLSDKTINTLQTILPSFISANNPVDLTSHALVEEGMLKKALEALLNDPDIDLIMIHFSVAGDTTRRIIAQLEEAYKATDKPIMCVSWSHEEQEHLLANELLRQAGIPTSQQAEHGVKALAALATYAEQYRLQQAHQKFSKKIISIMPDENPRQYLENIGRKQLTELEAKKLLKLYGIPVAQEDIASSPEEALLIADTIGYPVVLKILSPDILHKTEIGGVMLDLQTKEEVQSAYAQIMDNARSLAPEAKIEGILIAEMLPPGREMILGIKNDATFGNSILIGLGGVFVEVLRDFASAIPPLASYEAEALIKRLKGYPILETFRGLGPADTEGILDVLIKLSRMALDLEGIIAELEINPLIIGEAGQGVKAADALITLK